MTDIMLDALASNKMLEWKEREHELNDQVALGDQETMDAQRNCGLLKFFMCLGMRAHRCCWRGLWLCGMQTPKCLWLGTKN